jgi:hypothetical protein
MELKLTPSGDWEYTEDMGCVGRFDTYIKVEGHPKFDALRFYYFPGNGDLIEWVRDADHYTNNQEPIPPEVRQRVLEIVRDELRKALR